MMTMGHVSKSARADDVASNRLATAAGTVSKALGTVPLALWLLAITVVLGLLHYDELDGFVGQFNAGFGQAAGYFALIILPAFMIANALAASQVRANERLGTFLSPVLGAGMLCPDTAYATLSPFARRRKHMLAYGAYAGFKLLYPAGPLIIATGMGLVVDARLLLMGVIIFLPVWIAGILWARKSDSDLGASAMNPARAAPADAPGEDGQRRRPVFVCIGTLLTLIMLGLAWEPAGVFLQYLLSPQGALAVAALVALYFVVRHVGDAQAVGEVMQKSIRQTAGLILVIGLAAALGAILSDVFKFEEMVYSGTSTLGLILAGFATAALFKVIQGSSMATFAAVAPIAGYLVVNLPGMDAALVVYAVCAGSMIAILPNDSFFWLIKGNVGEDDRAQSGLLRNLVIGSTIQAIVGLAVILAIYFAMAAV